ncbi:MAG TPA: nicotinate-nucleotide adenylyltransferase [Dongiaceae bacterium]|nr:nicotinate-nucleotide adenylyltransferase [Dongiaceae bacterium]
MATSAVNAVGVLGGTFDPIHNGHLRLGWEAQSHLQLSQLRLVPCHLPTHREHPRSSAQHRLTMTQLACENVPGFQVDDWEIRRDQPSYSVHTLAHLREQLNDDTALVFILGMDSFNQFSSWHQWEKILELAHLGLAQRPGAELPAPETIEGRLLAQRKVPAAQLLQKKAGNISLFDTTALDISATQLRRQMAQGISPRFLLPDSVRAYIEHHELYRDDLNQDNSSLYRNADTTND